MGKIVDVLLDGFKHEAQQTRVVIETTKGVKPDHRPVNGMRTLRELSNHLAQSPRMDLAILGGEITKPEQAQAMEKDLNRESVADILKVFDEGVELVVKRLKGMTDKEALEPKLKPFYEQGPPKRWADYLQEMVTHMAMHKMQLWMYLKSAGVPVTMMTYYGVKH
ncbi:MAG: hypothetical protein C4K49_11135 [Candidatus Thorarchaeota archaeon]|nr:MAG: hypothetical protein C4K49_11135 [Candidatus Thorarchaeota archaeon]